MSKTIKIPKYPDRFDDSSNDVDVDDDRINEWILKCRVNLEGTEPGEYRYIASGNTLVMVIHHEDEYYYIVTKCYADASEVISEETVKVKIPHTAPWRKWFRKKHSSKLSK